MVSLRFVEFDVNDNIRNVVVLRPDQPSADYDTIACRTFDLGFPDVQVASYNLTEGNGVIDITRFHGASTVTVDITLLGSRKVFVYEQIRSMCHPYKRTYLYVDRPEWSGPRRILLRANSYSFISDKAAANRWDVSLSWSNPSGRMEAVEETVLDLELGTTGDIGDPSNGGYGSGLYGNGNYGNSPAPTAGA